MIEPRGTAGRGKRPGPTVRLSPSWQLPESHLVPDAVVAFVDGELSLGAHERAALHLMRCPSCAADVEAQRQVRAAVHSSNVPAMPPALLASLHSIPDTTELSTMPDNLAVDEHGQLVAVQRPVPPLGTVGMGSRGRPGRRAVQGAGVVMSGLVLSALALALGVDDSESPSAGSGAAPAGLSGGAAEPPSSLTDHAPQVMRLGVPQP